MELDTGIKAKGHQESWIGKKIDVKYWGCLGAIFALIFFFQYSFLHYLKIASDTGYHLANQELANRLGLYYIKIMPFWWLSDVMGGWWLKFSESYGLWGAKMGGVLALGTIGVISANTIFQLYKPSIGVVCAMALAAFALPYDLIYYHSVPTLFFAIFCLYFVKLHLNPHNTLYQILSGLSFVLLVFSRMPLIGALLMFPLILLICFWYDKKQLAVLTSSYLRVLGVILASFVLFACYLQTQDLLRSYIIYQTPTKYHSISALFEVLFGHLFKKIPYLIGIGCVAFGFHWGIKRNLLSGKSGKWISVGFLVLTVFLILLYLKYPAVKELKVLLFQSVWPDNFDLYPILISINIVYLCLMWSEINFSKIVLFLLGFSWPFLKGVGSATGLQCGIVVGFLLCGLTAVSLTRIARSYECRIPLFCLGAVLFIIIGGKAFKDNFDFRNTANIGVGKLEGIYTTPERAENYRSLVKEMGRYVKKRDQIIAAPYIPLVYYATDTVPLGEHASLYFLDIEQFSKKLDRIAETSPPVLIVRAKVDSQDPLKQQKNFEWPISEDFLDDLEQKNIVFSEKILNRWNLELIWSNDHYDIYLPKKAL
ncbi:MAG TPA: hypothetical protein VLE96_00105 [Chlamydiales bacterium]|nr:hypothetical protein [Chlamydiales bacterium]